MPINLDQLRIVLKSTGLPVYRDEAPTNAAYPYIVYEYVMDDYKRTSNRIFQSRTEYQISVITDGTEKDYWPIRDKLDAAGVTFSPFSVLPFDENDDKIMQFITYARCQDERI